MSLVLHISDLHLGSPSDWQLDYTDKFGLAPAAGDTKIDHLHRTLNAFGAKLAEEGRALDAVVISGDITNANQPDGYEELEDLLGELGAVLPPEDRIVVVPGNHDVDWSIQPGEAAKFKQFMDAVRSRYRTPLISGLDYDEASLERRTGSRQKARPVLELDDLVILALNSADYCGVEEAMTSTPWDEVVRSFRAGDASDAAKDAREAAKQDLRRLRVQDMARFDKRQFEALRLRLEGTALNGPAETDARVRIGVLHHPIGPVSDQEEIKAYDALSNLEKVRSFMFDRQLHVVLHGHKHRSYLGWDWVVPPSEDLDATPWRILVVGSPGDFRPDQTVCRLLETSPDDDDPVAGAPRMRIINVRGVRPTQGASLNLKSPCISLAQPFVRSRDLNTPWVVRATTANAAYQQLRDLPTNLDSPRSVISVVEDPETTDQLPANYPEHQDSQWLEDLVRWWQLPEPKAVEAFSGSDFNHGERLYGRRNAVERAAMALPSSKAVALLISSDEAGSPHREFPALTAVQLQARKDDDGTLIDAVGIYRKQDLALWWPVNMSELAYVQGVALTAASYNDQLEQPVARGRLVAIATIGLQDTVLPQMAGTVVDRSIDLRPEWLHRLAYLAAQPRVETQAEWEEALADIGTQEGGLLLVPSIGLERLTQALAMHQELGGAPVGFGGVVQAVERLAEDSSAAAEALDRDSRTQTRNYWQGRLQADVNGVRSALRSCVGAAGITWT